MSGRLRLPGVLAAVAVGVPPNSRYSASGYDASGPGRLVQRNNILTGSGTCETSGTVTEPRTYHAYTLDPAIDVPALVRAGTGIGKIGA